MADLFAGIDLNVRPLEHGNGDAGFDLNDMATILRLLLVFLYLVISRIIVFLSIGFDLNLPLDEYGAINFDFEENLAGKINFF